ncbi:ECF-type sigma factor [Aquabacterium sp. A7-Y]|uniref:ECF-type sigma factor n=1 Tax=Aquabacterium sp. A7-Y TaxID=1349605 RepID=UPI00223DD754|nr:ECF-type sigma factor [Aquabacterium sp. A7-Y]MCW7537054.1 ECF-type sigma factor [Aquabacterium sp. A7-Y]
MQKLRSVLAPSRTPSAHGTDGSGDITTLLWLWSRGDKQALDRLLPLVYQELRRLARRHLRRAGQGHGLEGTDLVHEAFLRIVRLDSGHWPSRLYFYGCVSRLMRHVLVDLARARHAAKRGGGEAIQSLDALQEQGLADALIEPTRRSASDLPDLMALDQALSRLDDLDPRQARVVEMRFLCGLSVEETATVLGVSPSTVVREAATARIWLARELKGGDRSPHKAGQSDSL